jgi:hypothetical protein
MGAAIGVLMMVVGALLIWSAGPRLAGVDTMFAGLVLIVLGAIGILLAFLLWSTEPRPSKAERRRLRGG